MPNNSKAAKDEQAARRAAAWRRIKQLQKEIADSPTYDDRSVWEIMEDMYDEYGLPK